MHSKRIPRERHSQWISEKVDSESNDLEETSSQSITKISGGQLHKTNKKKHPSSNSSRKKQRIHDIDTDNYSSDMIDRTEVSKKWDTKSESDISASEIHSDETLDEKDGTLSGRKKNNRNKKSKTKNENISHGSTAEKKSFSKKDIVKRKRKKRDEDEENSVELPITEILKKVQEQRTKYEEPVPLPELSTNTIYVQGRNGFNAVKIGGNSGKTSRQSYGNSPSTLQSKPIEVAIVFQQVWRSAGFIFQGLLGGMATFHLIFMETYFDNSEEFVSSYSNLSEIYTSVFSFLIALCIISTLDKIDLAHIGRDQLQSIPSSHKSSVMALLLYAATFALHQMTSKIDDKLALVHYNSSNITYRSIPLLNGSDRDVSISAKELQRWQRLTLSKDALVVLGWVFISVGSHKDMLLARLHDINKYMHQPVM